MAAPKRTGLGRGIGALIPGAEDADRPVDALFSPAGSRRGGGLVAVPGAQLANLSLEDIKPNRQQPRKDFRKEDLDELVVSIREFGVLQPIVVRPIVGMTPDGPRYELIMGERRLRAAKLAGLASIPAVIKNTADEDMLRDALLENLHRADLNPLEEASAYQQLLADFGITQDQLATRIGRSRPQITNTLRLLRPARRPCSAGSPPACSAPAMRVRSSRSATPSHMERLADKIVNEDLSVRAAEAAAGMGAPKAAECEAGERAGARVSWTRSRSASAIGSTRGSR